MVSANRYQVPEERPIPTLKIDPETERGKADRVRAEEGTQRQRSARSHAPRPRACEAATT